MFTMHVLLITTLRAEQTYFRKKRRLYTKRDVYTQKERQLYVQKVMYAYKQGRIYTKQEEFAQLHEGT